MFIRKKTYQKIKDEAERNTCSELNYQLLNERYIKLEDELEEAKNLKELLTEMVNIHAKLIKKKWA